MMKRTGSTALIAAVTIFSAACAIRLGGPKAEPYTATGLRAGASESATDVATRIKSAQANLVLLSASRDSAWFADVATQSGLTLTRPGRTGPATLGLMTRLVALGDTALTLNVTGGTKLHIKDALYKIDEVRSIDLMLVSFVESPSAREGVRALLNYIATDVNGNSALILGIEAPNKIVSDSVGNLVRAAFPNVLSCPKAPSQAPAGGFGIDLYYGPEARLSCESARILDGTTPAVVARVLVGR